MLYLLAHDDDLTPDMQAALYELHQEQALDAWYELEAETQACAEDAADLAWLDEFEPLHDWDPTPY